VDEVVAALHNDFEPVLFDRYSELAEVKASLIAAGARGALLSGTGSALFGIFETAAARDGARAELARAGRWQVFACATLAHHAYESES
jgi:4-diphosphocytidyl-2-C-methyl-D-erythritol kinase